jgi:ppGpp synthetase/RelA/SpoT-type nucleotidyltranferase
MAFDVKLIARAVERYSRERDRYLKLAARVADLARAAILEDSSIRAQITSRTKSVRSFEGKLRRFAKSGDKNFKSVDDIFESIGDFAGVRVATYRPEDQDHVEQEICQIFVGPDGGSVVPDPKDNINFEKSRFYRGVHCQVCLPEEELVGDFENLRGASCEIQICSMMAHVWNEIEHDIAYKPLGMGPGPIEKGLLLALGHLTCSGDATISRLLEATEHRLAEQTGDFTDVHDFVARMRKDYEGIELSVNAGIAFDLIKILDLMNPEKIASLVGTGKGPIGEAQALIGKFNAYLDSIGASDLRLNPHSADVLSVALLERDAKRIGDYYIEHSASRPPRAAMLARRYLEFLDNQQDTPADVQVAS